jgi:hypothetical protein
LRQENSSLLENLNLIISDKENKIISYDIAINKLINNGKLKDPVSVKIYAFLTINDNCVFEVTCNLSKYIPPYSKDIYFSSSTSLKSNENSNEYKAASSVINIAGLKNEITYNLGLVFADNISSNITQINNSLSIVRDLSFYRNETNQAKNLTQSLKSYVETQQADPAITQFFYKYIPLVPIVFDLLSPMIEDRNLFTGRISLLKSSNYIPDLLDVISQGGTARISYIVVIDQYTFTSIYLVKEEVIQTLNEAASSIKNDSTKALPVKIIGKLAQYAKHDTYKRIIDSLKDLDDVTTLCKNQSFNSISIDNKEKYYKNFCDSIPKKEIKNEK